MLVLSACGGGGSGGDGPQPGLEPVVSVSDAERSESAQPGAANLEFYIRLSWPAANDVTGTYETLDDTATAGLDYAAVSAGFMIPAGSTEVMVTVPVLDDDITEATERLSFVLSDVAGAQVADATGIGTIFDKSALPRVRINDVSVAEPAGAPISQPVEVSLSGPAQANVTGTVTSEDVTATAGTDYIGLSVPFEIPAGQTKTTIEITVFADSAAEPDESFLLRLNALSGAVADDAEAVVTITDNLTERPELRILDASAAEPAGASAGATTNLGFVLQLSQAAQADVTGSYRAASGSAIEGVDFVATDSVFTIPAGSQSLTVNVPVIGDAAFEGDEDFAVDIYNVFGADVVDANAIGTIIDNDAANVPAIRIADAAAAETDAGTEGSLDFTLTLDAPAPAAVSGRVTAADGTAVAGADYRLTADTFSIPAGARSATISVAVIGDNADEPDETFLLNLASVSGANITDGQGTGRITDNDPLPVLSVGEANVVAIEGAGKELTFRVSLSEVSGRAVTVRFVTRDDTATAGSDYTAVNRQFTIPAGADSVAVSVPLLDDSVYEGSEQLTVTIVEAKSATIGTGRAVGTIDDDEQAALPGLPANPSCVALDKPTDRASIELTDAFPDSPGFGFITKILQEPNNGERWYALEKFGAIKVFSTSNPANVTNWITLGGRVNSDGEGGLLGMAFDPNFPATPHIYVSYTAGPDKFNIVSKVSRLVLDNPRAAAPGWKEEVLLEINQPYSNHNGGDIAFGPLDGYLYIGFGDGGNAGDPGNRAQDPTNMLGAMLRIDVAGVPYSQANPYRIPVDNPFYDPARPGARCSAEGDDTFPCPEIFAYGLRNPWRWSFDASTGDIWAGDVGQNLWEEVNRVVIGGNYGWDCREGLQAFDRNGNQVCQSPPAFIEPVLQYPHADGNSSVTGGFVYRGTDIPALIGRYVFGDFISGRIWALQEDAQGRYSREELVDTPYLITAFANGYDGELYVVSYDPSRIYRLKARNRGVDTIPDNLADTGCLNTGALVPYAINAPFWSDGAVKKRYMSLPGGKKIRVDGKGDWIYPEGAVLVKSFELGGKLIETRLLMRHPGGEWGGYTYEWDAAGQTATRVRGGKTKAVAGQTWIYPSEGQCLQCHTAAAGFSLGPETAQLNGDFRYPATGVTANQLAALQAAGAFQEPFADDPSALPALPDPQGNAALTARAKSYLHTNCSQCHRPGGPTPSTMDLRYTTPLPQMKICNEAPSQGDMDIEFGKLVSPGKPNKSVLLNRMSRRDASGMPPIGSTKPDAAGVQLITRWIEGLDSCSP